MSRRLLVALALASIASACATRRYVAVVPAAGDEVIARLRVRRVPPPEPEPLADLTCDGPGPDAVAVVDVALGQSHACVVLADGTARCWGSGNSGALGDGSRANTATPTRVEGVSGLRAITTGRAHSCALDQRGRVWCWGDSGYRQLGRPIEGTSTSRAGEVDGLRDVVRLDAGSDHTCAVTRRGEVYCWGRNHDGQLGDGARDRYERPVLVPRLRASAVAAGHTSSCAVTRDAAVACWGGINGSRTPQIVAGLPAAAVEVVVGRGSACARLVDGAVHCWGDGSHGQLGPHARGYAEHPVWVEGLPPARAIVAWGTHVCATDVGGGVWCWGSDAPFDPESASPRHRALLGVAEQAAIGDDAACARMAAGGLCCWGDNSDGILGAVFRAFDRPANFSEVPVPMAW
ncbi:MAG: hypothetical protein KF729_14410 [Sandaracinaceae bacterium]|nr:hypothetical protein [Sandaracinaceae bacterium]